MQVHKKVTALLTVMFVVTVAYSITTLKAQNPQNPVQSKQEEQQRAEFESQFPVTDYDSLEPTDPEKRARRKEKNKRHNNSKFVSSDSSDRISSIALLPEGIFDFPALPAEKSDAVVIGEVLSTEAHLSDDKTNIYSEFSIRIDEVLKGGNSIGGLISAERIGGVVRFGNGHKRYHYIVGMGMPRVGRKYVLFLNAIDQSQDFRILTGYELKTSNVRPLDDSKQFNAYDGYDSSAFLQKVRDAVAQSSQQAQ